LVLVLELILVISFNSDDDDNRLLTNYDLETIVSNQLYDNLPSDELYK